MAFQRRELPPLKQPGWTVLVQSVDLHDEDVHALMNQFRFMPDARLDDVMISFATDGGGVGHTLTVTTCFCFKPRGAGAGELVDRKI